MSMSRSRSIVTGEKSRERMDARGATFRMASHHYHAGLPELMSKQ